MGSPTGTHNLNEINAKSFSVPVADMIAVVLQAMLFGSAECMSTQLV